MKIPCVVLVVLSGVGLSNLLSRPNLGIPSFGEIVPLLCHLVQDDDEPLCVSYDIGVPIILLVEGSLRSIQHPCFYYRLEGFSCQNWLC